MSTQSGKGYDERDCHKAQSARRFHGKLTFNASHCVFQSKDHDWDHRISEFEKR